MFRFVKNDHSLAMVCSVSDKSEILDIRFFRYASWRNLNTSHSCFFEITKNEARLLKVKTDPNLSKFRKDKIDNLSELLKKISEEREFWLEKKSTKMRDERNLYKK